MPVKLLQYNRCPAVAPLGVLDAASQERLSISLDTIQKHLAIIKQARGFAPVLCEAAKQLDGEQAERFGNENHVDGQIYGSFYPDGDKRLLMRIRRAQPADMNLDQFPLTDKRLQGLLPLYKARNYPASLSSEELVEWEKHRTERLFSGGQNSRLAQYFAKLQELAAKSDITSDQQYVLEELQLYGQSIMPSDMQA